MNVRSPYAPRERHITTCTGDGHTKQSFKDECDINFIMKKYIKTGVVEHLNQNKANYGFATALDFKASLDLIQEAQDLFSGLPAELRDKFDNDPGEFLAFVENPDNRSEMALMGLLNEEATAAALAADSASDSASAPTPPNPAEPAPTPE